MASVSSNGGNQAQRARNPSTRAHNTWVVSRAFRAPGPPARQATSKSLPTTAADGLDNGTGRVVALCLDQAKAQGIGMRKTVVERLSGLPGERAAGFEDIVDQEDVAAILFCVNKFGLSASAFSIGR